MICSEGIQSPARVIIDTSAGRNLIKQNAVNPKLPIDEKIVSKLTGINNLLLFIITERQSFQSFNVWEADLKKPKHISQTDRIIANKIRKTSDFLKNNKDLLVTRVDKGNVTIVMRNEVYKETMNSMLKDNYRYKKIETDPLEE